MKEFEQFEMKMFSGYLANDVECKYNDNGLCISKFSIPLRNKKDDEAVWLNCVVFGVLAERVAETYKKSSKIIIIGKFTENVYNHKSYITFVVDGVL